MSKQRSPDVGVFSLVIVILAVTYIMWVPPEVIARATVLYDGEIITGTVVNTSGEPVVGATISIIPEEVRQAAPDQSFVAATETDAEGFFEIEAEYVPLPQDLVLATPVIQEEVIEEEPINLLIQNGPQDQVALTISELQTSEVTVQHKRSFPFPIPLLVY